MDGALLCLGHSIVEMDEGQHGPNAMPGLRSTLCAIPHRFSFASLSVLFFCRPGFSRLPTGIISTVGLAMVNVVPAELLTSQSFGYEGHEGRARLCFVISLMMTFGGLTAAIVCFCSAHHHRS